MRALAPIFVSLAALACPALAGEDPLVDRYKEFFRTSIAPSWEDSELSEMHVVMLRGFERHDVPDAAEWLISQIVAGSEAADEVRTALDVLAAYSRPETVATIVEAWDKRLRKPAERRALGLFALRGKGKNAEQVAAALVEGLTDRDPRVARAACQVAGECMRREVLDPVRALLESREPMVRGAAALALAEMSDDESLPVLFDMFCRDDSHRARYDLWMALRKLSREDLPCRPAAWEEWWTKQRGEPVEGEESPWGGSFPRVNADAAEPGPFFGIPVLADRVVLVIDTSQSMLEPWNIDHQAERAKPPEERTPGFFSVKTRWDLVRNHVRQLLEGLPEDVEVGFVFYDMDVWKYPEGGKLLRNSPRNRAKILQYLDTEVEPKGTTTMYDGLAAGWGFVRDGDPDANLKKGADTILFVTDGTPTDGTFAKRDDRIRDEAWAIATGRGVRIHTVGIHYHAYELCKAMAKDSGGLYVHEQQAGDTTEPQDLDFWPKKKQEFEARRKAGNR